eukprot:g7869.t1
MGQQKIRRHAHGSQCISDAQTQQSEQQHLLDTLESRLDNALEALSFEYQSLRAALPQPNAQACVSVSAGAGGRRSGVQSQHQHCRAHHRLDRDDHHERPHHRQEGCEGQQLGNNWEEAIPVVEGVDRCRSFLVLLLLMVGLRLFPE